MTNVYQENDLVCSECGDSVYCPSCSKRIMDVNIMANVPITASLKCLHCHSVVKIPLVGSDNTHDEHHYQKKSFVKQICPRCSKRILDVSDSPGASVIITLKCRHCNNVVKTHVNLIRRGLRVAERE